ncbi:MAG: polyprenol phosphomannose-dependent alpha 1,6 mannosyltransferase MptB [Herpetosiphonaceae bacterium]|nr:polyprenol phosphomannose-dependent alpha 1,6 mannosyltransferase MptB [Herpetosiphonaceae bacterium]
MQQSRFAEQRRVTTRLALTVLPMLAVYAALTWRYPLTTLLPIYRSNIGSVTKQPWIAVANLSLAGVTLYGLYLAGVLLCWRVEPTRRMVMLVWSGAILAALLLVAIYPVTSTDIFDYLFRGRIGAFYGKNPYLAVPSQFKQDPLAATVGWPNAPSAYGPLWETMSQGIAHLAGASLKVNVLLHKAVAVLTYLGCGLAIWVISRPSGRRAQLIGSFLWLWSPLALWEIVGAGHNDGLLLLAVLLGVWAAEQRRTFLAVVALTIGTLLKFLPILLLPLVVVYGMRSAHTWRSRSWIFVVSLLIFSGLTVVAYQPYWAGMRTFQNITVRENFVTTAPLAVASYWLRQAAPLKWINDLLVTLHLPHPAEVNDVVKSVSRTGSGLLGLGLLWQLWQIWRHGRGIWRASFGLLLWYLTFGSQWFEPWYVLWLIGLLALRPDRRTWSWLTAWSLGGQSSYLLQYFIQPQLSKQFGANWGAQSVKAQALFCLIIFVPPLVVWTAGWLWGRGAGRAPRLVQTLST